MKGLRCFRTWTLLRWGQESLEREVEKPHCSPPGSSLWKGQQGPLPTLDCGFAAPMVLTICGSKATKATLWEVSIGFWGTKQQDLPCAQSMLGAVPEGWAGGSGQVWGEYICRKSLESLE